MSRSLLPWLVVGVLAASVAGTPGAGIATPSEARVPSAFGLPSTTDHGLRGAPQSEGVRLSPLRGDGGGRVTSGAPQPSGSVGTVLIGGYASWYDDPRKSGRYAAAGPLLREALGDWRGKVIRVTSGNRATLVQLSDWCACGYRNTVPTLIDLSPLAFADLAPLAQGLVRVEIEVLALPATDTPDQHPQDPPEHEDDARMRLEDR